MLKVRLATPRDLAAVDALLARSYPRLLKADYPPSILVTALPIMSRAQPALLASGSYFLAEIDGQVVGAGGWTAARRAGWGEVRHLVVDDRHLRRGIARGLMRAAMDQARQAGIRALNTMSTRTAVPFYMAMGFTTLGPVEVSLGGAVPFPAVQMQREL